MSKVIDLAKGFERRINAVFVKDTINQCILIITENENPGEIPLLAETILKSKEITNFYFCFPKASTDFVSNLLDSIDGQITFAALTVDDAVRRELRQNRGKYFFTFEQDILQAQQEAMRVLKARVASKDASPERISWEDTAESKRLAELADFYVPQQGEDWPS